jgi:hypothetical protein
MPTNEETDDPKSPQRVQREKPLFCLEPIVLYLHLPLKHGKEHFVRPGYAARSHLTDPRKHLD